MQFVREQNFIYKNCNKGRRHGVVVASQAHILVLRVRATRRVYQFFDMPSDLFLLLFRAVSRALMVLNYSHWVLLGQELA